MNTLISIVGPTGIGKTKLSIYLAKKFKTEIISCDSRQFYKELNIGTSKPSNKQLKQIKHHFIGHLNIKKNYNISLFEKDVIKQLNKLFKKYKVIIMVGGSGLYEKTIIEGINLIPNIKKKKKLKIRKILNKKKLEYLLNKLKKKDINYYNLLKNKKDKRKIIKALEFKYCTKKKLSSFYYKKKPKRPFKKYIRIGLKINRKKIYNNINKKVDLMIKKGLINEAKKYYKYKNLNALNTIGYKEIFKYLKNKDNIKNCIEEIKQKTRNFAKKQIIWFKKYKNIKWFKPNNYKKIYIYLINKLNKYLQ
ncbi:tRNA (adenosine(37)-N6)-dimethylallyltransferase MiaA [Candidatus Shikimatogenerans bostrichidophilus]|uniref:tRNA (adenosine(37)-N6)-dimethylallyltransferase MiaA n=1 Tax=Candidatus Shikimatogenerans bostrichidophilus TaxID=2943807 RepID=UPI0029663E4C